MGAWPRSQRHLRRAGQPFLPNYRNRTAGDCQRRNQARCESRIRVARRNNWGENNRGHNDGTCSRQRPIEHRPGGATRGNDTLSAHVK